VEQTRLVSLVEALFNTFIGFLVSFLSWPIAASLTGVVYTTDQHFWLVSFFTVISVLRGYVIRRWFNNGLHLAALRVAKEIKSILSSWI